MLAWSSVHAVNNRQTVVQQNGVEKFHLHQATPKQETGLSSLPWDLSNPPTKQSHELTGWHAENAQSFDRS